MSKKTIFIINIMMIFFNFKINAYIPVVNYTLLSEINKIKQRNPKSWQDFQNNKIKEKICINWQNFQNTIINSSNNCINKKTPLLLITEKPHAKLIEDSNKKTSDSNNRSNSPVSVANFDNDISTKNYDSTFDPRNITKNQKNELTKENNVEIITNYFIHRFLKL